MASDEDLRLIDRHLGELLGEVTSLREALDEAAPVLRAATLDEVDEALRPAIEALSRWEAGQAPVEEVAVSLIEGLGRLGLTRQQRAGEVLDLFPEEAREDFALDRSISPRAMAVSVRVLSSGWRRGLKPLVLPRGVVLEVSEDREERDEG